MDSGSVSVSTWMTGSSLKVTDLEPGRLRRESGDCGSGNLMADGRSVGMSNCSDCDCCSSGFFGGSEAGGGNELELREESVVFARADAGGFGGTAGGSRLLRRPASGFEIGSGGGDSGVFGFGGRVGGATCRGGGSAAAASGTGETRDARESGAGGAGHENSSSVVALAAEFRDVCETRATSTLRFRSFFCGAAPLGLRAAVSDSSSERSEAVESTERERSRADAGVGVVIRAGSGERSTARGGFGSDSIDEEDVWPTLAGNGGGGGSMSIEDVEPLSAAKLSGGGIGI